MTGFPDGGNRKPDATHLLLFRIERANRGFGENMFWSVVPNKTAANGRLVYMPDISEPWPDDFRAMHTHT